MKRSILVLLVCSVDCSADFPVRAPQDGATRQMVDGGSDAMYDCGLQDATNTYDRVVQDRVSQLTDSANGDRYTGSQDSGSGNTDRSVTDASKAKPDASAPDASLDASETPDSVASHDASYDGAEDDASDSDEAYCAIKVNCVYEGRRFCAYDDGVAIFCCPANRPHYCPLNRKCYLKAKQAAKFCGNHCQICK